MVRTKDPPASTLLLDEYFEAGDERFLDELFACTAEKRFKRLAERWYRDRRPFARRALLRYVDDGCDRPHHRPLVKALYKLAEAELDDELIGHFLVAFDRMPYRVLLRPGQDKGVSRPVLQRRREVPQGRHGATQAGRFSARTRMYLRRRALRYLRTLGRADPPRFAALARAALARYEDAHLEKPEQLLDAWGLVHLLYWGSPVLRRDPVGVVLRPGRSLAELEPAPMHPAVWRNAFEPTLQLLETARSGTVRGWAMALLRRDYEPQLRRLPVARLRTLLRNPSDEVQTFAAEYLRTASGLERLPLADWLELLRIESVTALSVVCALVVAHVHPARLTLGQCVELACARPAPVAELGLRWLRDKPVRTGDEIATLMALGNAAAPGVRGDAAAWLAEVLERSPHARPEHVRDLLDARYPETRARGLALLERDPRFRGETVLWAALSESPYDDARTFLLRHLEAVARELSPESVRHVWATALLAVHRGGRAKRLVVNQVAARVAREPGRADELLPLLAVALRSVRAPERRSALAAVARAALRNPALGAAIARALPELKLSGEVAA